MKKAPDSTPWYGELRTKRGNTIIIRDDELPPTPTPGRIYLYNTERDAMVQYDEAIVSDKLFPLDAEQEQQAQSQFKSAWEAARKQLIKSHGKLTSAASDTEAEAETEEKTKVTEDIIPEVDTDDDDFDDD